MAKSVQLKDVFLVHLILTWSGVVYASESSFAAGMASISRETMLCVFALSAVGGTLGTLVRMSAENAVPVRNLTLAIAKDGIGSLVSGMIAFLLTSWGGYVPFFPQAVLITLAGFGGSKFVEVAFTDGAVPWFKLLLQRLLNIKDKGST